MDTMRCVGGRPCDNFVANSRWNLRGLRQRVRSRPSRFLQGMSFMHRNVVGLAALDFVLWIVLARVVDVSLVVDVLGMHFDDRAADMACLGIPGYPIADLESSLRHQSPLAELPATTTLE